MLNQIKNNASILVYALFVFGLLPFLYLERTLDPETLPRCIALAGLLIFYHIYYLMKARENDFSVLKHPVLICFLLYALAAVFSLSKAVNLGDSFYDLLRIVLYFSFLFITHLLLKNNKYGIASLIQCVNTAVLIFTAYGVFQLID